MSVSRVRALWELASVRERDTGTRFTRMLEIGARSLRPEKALLGTLSRLDRGEIRYEAVAWTGDPVLRPLAAMVVPTATIPFGETLQSLIYADGSAHAWNDMEQGDIAKVRFRSRSGVRSVIGCAMQIGARTYFLMFSSPEAMTDTPYKNDDIDFVNVTGRIFAGTVNQIEYIERLRHQMEHDGLTGLANRIQFRKAMRAEIALEQPFALGLVNIDRFRQINDFHGQTIADEALVEIASELDGIGPNDFVARMSGDEFAILVRNPINGNDIGTVAEKYLERFQHPFHTGDREGTRLITLAASAGWAFYPEHGEIAEDLLRRADVSLDIAKERGGGIAVVFNDSIEQVIQQRRTSAADIKRAILENEFRLAYQPTFELATGEIIGAEALIRWDHPDRGLLSPADFIPIAERNGLIGSLSHWVLVRLVDELNSAESLPEGFRCYFNLAAQNLHDFSFMTALSDALAAFPHLIDHLGVEITETTAMLNVEESLNSLQLIQGMGVKVAIDDFGTGYSSLSYLKRLSVDLIKIDRSFISGLPDDAQDAALTETMIGICARFNLKVLGEGIETLAQRDWLLAHGCHYGQGYLVAQPMRFVELLEFIRNVDPGERFFGLERALHARR